MRAMRKYFRHYQEIRGRLTSQKWAHLLSGHPEDFMKKICDKIHHPQLACSINLSQRISSFYPWAFSHDNCDNCGIKRLHKISENEILINSNTVIDPIKWKNIAGQDLKAMILVKHSLS